MINFKSAFFAFLILASSHYVAYYYGSQKPAQIVEREAIKRDVETRIVEVVKPDGSKEVQTVIIDKSKESSTAKTPVLVPKPDWVVGAYYRLNDPTYALSVSRRILGPFSASAFGDLSGNVYLGVSVEF